MATAVSKPPAVVVAGPVSRVDLLHGHGDPTLHFHLLKTHLQHTPALRRSGTVRGRRLRWEFPRLVRRADLAGGRRWGGGTSRRGAAEKDAQRSQGGLPWGDAYRSRSSGSSRTGSSIMWLLDQACMGTCGSPMAYARACATRGQARAQRHWRLRPAPGRCPRIAKEKVKVLDPARAVHALNMNLDNLGAQPRYPGGFVLDHGSMAGQWLSTPGTSRRPSIAVCVD